MIHPKLLQPDSIVVVGASENIQSPGGKVLYNLLNNNFSGKLYGVNPKLEQVQGVPCFTHVSLVPEVDLAIIAVAAKYCEEIIQILTTEKNTKAFIIFSAGFSEQDQEGKDLEKRLVAIIDKHGGTLLGPNNIGMFNTHFTGVFTTPIPTLDPNGVDFISGSGATAVFIMEAAQDKGLRFNSLYSVGNSAQIGVEDVLAYLDETYQHGISAKVKLLYIESIQDPQKLLKHAHSLTQKGAKIAAIKAGSSSAGSRAASSHTGALANSDTAVDALFKKAGIIRCDGREDLVYVAGVLSYPNFEGKNIGIITHAGGPAVMLTDVLSKNGLQIPSITNSKRKVLSQALYPGSSVNNPIDFLATGTAEQLGIIIDYCDRDFDEIDAMVVIFGSPGLFSVHEVYEVLAQKIGNSKKPILPILPSVVNVGDAIETFTAKGYFAFSDEVLFGKALAKCKQNISSLEANHTLDPLIQTQLKQIIKNQKGYLSPAKIQDIFQVMGIPSVEEVTIENEKEIKHHSWTFPLVAKVIGPIHKSDVSGVFLDIKNEEELKKIVVQLLQIPTATGVLIQPMLNGQELFIGAKKETNFGHLIVCGLGGIFIEIIKDVSTNLSPLSHKEVEQMIQSLQAYPLFTGIRGKKGIDQNQFEQIIKKVDLLVQYLPEISELDLNPLLATSEGIIAVDARIKVESKV